MLPDPHPDLFSDDEPMPADAAASAGATTGAPPGRRVPPMFDHGETHPRQRAAQHRLMVLHLANRFRQLRAIDVAAGLFAARNFKAALSAAQRTMGGLVRDRMLTRYRSLSGQTYYGLAARGASLLRESSVALEAEPSASRACEKTNPEHSLWSAFAVLCCEARGLRAMTETELRQRLATPDDPRPFPLSYSPDGRSRKGLMPDAIALEAGGVVWFEIDRSARGSARLDDLIGLVSRMGSAVRVGGQVRLALRRIVVWCKTPGILRRGRTHLTGAVPRGGETAPRLHVGIEKSPALRRLGDEVYEVLRDVDVKLPDGREQRRTVVAGVLHLQLLPTHLSSYSYRDGPARGWFDDAALPYRRVWNEESATPSDGGYTQ